MKPKSPCSNHLWFSLPEEFAEEDSDKYTAPVQKGSVAHRASHKASTCESCVRHIFKKIQGVSHVHELSRRTSFHVTCLPQGVNMHTAGWPQQEGYDASSHWQ